jgi:hypothetical protein
VGATQAIRYLSAQGLHTCKLLSVQSTTWFQDHNLGQGQPLLWGAMCAGLLGVSGRGVSARARSDTEKLLGVESFVLETQTLTDTFIID